MDKWDRAGISLYNFLGETCSLYNRMAHMYNGEDAADRIFHHIGYYIYWGRTAQAVDLAMYADDTALYISYRSDDIVCRRFQGAVDDAEDKCVVLRFTRKISETRLTFRQHINDTVQRFVGARVALLPLICKRSTLSLRSKVLRYIAFLRPLLTYVPLPWSSVAADLAEQNAKNDSRRTEMIVFARTWVFRQLPGTPSN